MGTFREASSLDTEPKYKNIAAGLPHDIKGHLGRCSTSEYIACSLLLFWRPWLQYALNHHAIANKARIASGKKELIYATPEGGLNVQRALHQILVPDRRGYFVRLEVPEHLKQHQHQRQRQHQHQHQRQRQLLLRLLDLVIVQMKAACGKMECIYAIQKVGPLAAQAPLQIHAQDILGSIVRQVKLLAEQRLRIV